MPLEFLNSLPAPLRWVLVYGLWFVAWAPVVAVLEYFAHRWIMHLANRLLDPNLCQLKAHGAHHRGANEDEYVDVPLRNCLLLTAPFFLLLLLWGAFVGPFAAVVIPAAALLSWSFIYRYLWARIHRAVHGLETNWCLRFGPLFRFFRNHHLTHHTHAKSNYGTVFPWSDYVFFTWRLRDRPVADQRQGSRADDDQLAGPTPR